MGFITNEAVSEKLDKVILHMEEQLKNPINGMVVFFLCENDKHQPYWCVVHKYGDNVQKEDLEVLKSSVDRHVLEELINLT